MIVVRYRGMTDSFEQKTFDDNASVKVLASGALKVFLPMEIEVPPKGSKEEAIVTAPERVLGVINGDYIMTREKDK